MHFSWLMFGIPPPSRFSAVVVALNSANFSPMPVSHDVQTPFGNAAPNACPTVFVVLDGSVASLTMPTISTGTFVASGQGQRENRKKREKLSSGNLGRFGFVHRSEEHTS